MAEAIVLDTTPNQVAFINRPYSNADRVKRDEDELAELIEAQKRDNEAETVDTQETADKEPTSAEERTFKKRYGDLRRHTQQKELDLQKRIEELEAAVSTTKPLRVPKSDDELSAWMADNPDLASIIETVAAKKAAEQSESLSTRFEELDQRERDTLTARAEQELRSAHPDIDEIKDDDAFHAWAEDQPKWVQDSLYENDTDANAAARAIDLYKSDVAKKAKPKNRKASDAKAATLVDRGQRSGPTDNPDGGFSESQVEAMTIQQYSDNEKAITASVRKGTFVYDISGGAR